MTHKKEKSRNQDEVLVSAFSLSNYSSQQQQTATKTRQSMIIPGTTGKKQQPQQQLNMSSNKYANDISAISVGGASQNSANSGFINNKRPQVKSMSGAGFMQISNFRASAANLQKNRFSIKQQTAAVTSHKKYMDNTQVPQHEGSLLLHNTSQSQLSQHSSKQHHHTTKPTPTNQTKMQQQHNYNTVSTSLQMMILQGTNNNSMLNSSFMSNNSSGIIG